jgi:hypothetical protein
MTDIPPCYGENATRDDSMYLSPANYSQPPQYCFRKFILKDPNDDPSVDSAEILERNITEIGPVDGEVSALHLFLKELYYNGNDIDKIL